MLKSFTASSSTLKRSTVFWWINKIIFTFISS